MTDQGTSASGPIWTKWWMIALYVVLGVGLGAILFGGGSTDSGDEPSAAPTSTLATGLSTSTSTDATTTTVTEPSTTSTTSARPTTTTTSRKPSADPVIVEEGFWTAGNLDDAGWVAIVENPNGDWLLTRVSFDINVVDADNRVIDTDFDSVGFILPNGQAVISGRVFDPPAEIASLEFEASWDTEDVSGQLLGEFVVSDVKVEEASRRTVWSGNVTSTFDEEMKSAEVSVVLRDGDGNLIGVNFTFADVTSERQTFWEITMFDAPNFESYEVMVSP